MSPFSLYKKTLPKNGAGPGNVIVVSSRSLGVHISKVRSITLDAWEPEILKVMAELGNQIVNKIYEANVHEIVAKRATPDCGSPERENWIKAKYVARAFIRSDLLKSDGEKSGNTGRWTVRRLRRRARTSSLKRQSAKEKLDKDDKDVDTTTEVDTEKKELKPKSAATPAAGSSSPKVNAEEILFGTNLGKHHVANMDLDSDQESTDGEEESESSMLSSEILLAKLTPHHLLFRAARVHNLPVMNQALALGANVEWISPDGSAIIHQSILSGSVMACEYLLLNGAKINIQVSGPN